SREEGEVWRRAGHPSTGFQASLILISTPECHRKSLVGVALRFSGRALSAGEKWFDSIGLWLPTGSARRARVSIQRRRDKALAMTLEYGIVPNRCHQSNRPRRKKPFSVGENHIAPIRSCRGDPTR